MHVVKGFAFFVMVLIFGALVGEHGLALCQAGYALDTIMLVIYLLFGACFAECGIRSWRRAIGDRRKRRHQAATAAQQEVLQPSWSQNVRAD